VTIILGALIVGGVASGVWVGKTFKRWYREIGNAGKSVRNILDEHLDD